MRKETSVAAACRRFVLRALVAVVAASAIALPLGACAATAPQKGQTEAPAADATGTTPETGELSVTEVPKFGSVYLDMTIDEFNQAGFEPGDSVDVIFSNGFTLGGIPYYDGYYTSYGAPLVCAYQGYPHICIANNNGALMWEEAGLTETDTGRVVLRERGVYKSTQDALSITYTNERADYASDEVFANFRALSGGRITSGSIYRSASPCDNQYNRATYVLPLVRAAGVRHIIDLADDAEDIEQYLVDAKDSGFDISYLSSLLDEGHVSLAGLSADYRSEDYAAKLTAALRETLVSDGPLLVHCTEGKDRTGFACALLEALCGASYSEMEADYMKTYDNYYGITKESAPDRYGAIVDVKFSDIALCIGGKEPGSSLEGVDYEQGARDYLIAGGMSSEEVDALAARLTAA